MRKLQEEISHYLAERGWTNMVPADVAKSISIEAAELLELFQWGHESAEETKLDSERMRKIKRELADVLIYALDMAIVLEIDADTITREKLEDIKKKYPAKEMNAVGGTAHTRYREIKQEYREKGIS